MRGMETGNTIAQRSVTDELKPWGLHVYSYSKSYQCNIRRPEIFVRTTHFLHPSCLLVGVRCCLLSCLFLMVIRVQNIRVLKAQEFSSPTGQEIPCMLLNQSVFHFRCHSISPLLPGLSQFNSIHVPRSCLRCILIFMSPLRLGLPCVRTSFRFSTTKSLCALPYYHMLAHFIPLDFIDHLKNNWWKVQMKLFIVQLSPFLVPRHPILNRPQSVFFPYHTRYFARSATTNNFRSRL